MAEGDEKSAQMLLYGFHEIFSETFAYLEMARILVDLPHQVLW